METIISGAISATVTLLVCLINNHVQHKEMMTLLTYRLTELEKKVDKLSDITEKMSERMHQIEETSKLNEAELKRLNHRMEDVERGKVS